jgi:hypothetical protein
MISNCAIPNILAEQLNPNGRGSLEHDLLRRIRNFVAMFRGVIHGLG